jgi:putative acetyltransferase
MHQSVRDGEQGEPVVIRFEEKKDWAAIHAVNSAAFRSPAEADLVDALRREGHPVISLVAEDSQALIGHIMFSPVVLSGYHELRIMGLAPMAVLPQHQRRGIGSTLVRAGLAECKKLSFGAVVVLGHPDYYPRFGFDPALRFGISCEYEAPEEAFMLVELEPGYLRVASGKVKYHASFSDL